MAHKANDALGPIVIKGTGPAVELLELVARFKGRTTHIFQSNRLELVERNLSIIGLWPAIEYLEERYPEPPIFPDTPPRRAIVRSIAAQALDATDTILPKLRESAGSGPKTRYLLSDEVTLLDLAVAVVAKHPDWSAFVQSVLGSMPAPRRPGVAA